jgi:Domain of unknown function (DUF4261)
MAHKTHSDSCPGVNRTSQRKLIDHDLTQTHMRKERIIVSTSIALAACLLCMVTGAAQTDVMPKKRNMNLAFVLLSKPALPKSEDVVHAFSLFGLKEQRLGLQGAETKTPSKKDILMFDVSSGETAFVALMPVPVPKGEADDAVRFSVSAIGTGWKLPAHKAHLIVSVQSTDSSSLVESISCFTSFLAAIAKATSAVGIYWGEAGATHDPEFFISTAREPGLVPRITLWTGVSVALEPDGRMSLLSLGMKQLKLPDLLLVVPKAAGNDALAMMFDLLGYVASLGKPLPDGDTVGRTADERLPVSYVPSPLDSTKKVWRVELK